MYLCRGEAGKLFDSNNSEIKFDIEYDKQIETKEN